MYPCYPPLVYSCGEMLILPAIIFSLFYNFNINSPILTEFLSNAILKHPSIFIKTFVFGKGSSGKQFENLICGLNASKYT